MKTTVSLLGFVAAWGLMVFACSEQSSSSPDGGPDAGADSESNSETEDETPSDSESEEPASDTGSETTPPDVAVRQVAAGFGHTCAIDEAGTLYCWGANQGGQIGNGQKNPSKAFVNPLAVIEPGPWKDVCAGIYHTCAVKEDGSLWCFGQNAQGQLGTDDTNQRLVPTRIGTATWADVACDNFEHTCGIQADGSLWCWGDNNYGQLGIGTAGGPGVNADRKRPQLVSDESWLSVATGGAHVCAVREDGALFCFGANANDRLGFTSESSAEVPVESLPVAVRQGVEAVAAGGGVTLPLDADGTLVAAGLNEQGQTGTGGAPSDPVGFAPVSGGPFRAACAGGSHGCAIDEAGDLWCFGVNESGQLGLAEPATFSDVPLLLSAGSFTSLSCGGEHSCALDDVSRLWCWGYNFKGQLGNGTSSATPTPGLTAVVFLPE